MSGVLPTRLRKMGLGDYFEPLIYPYSMDLRVRRGRERLGSCRITSRGRMAHETRHCRLKLHHWWIGWIVRHSENGYLLGVFGHRSSEVAVTSFDA